MRRPVPQVTGPEELDYYAECLRLTTLCQDHLEAETSRLTEALFKKGDPATVRQAVVGDLRRQVDAAINNLKQRINGERSEWTRRFAKQTLDVQEGLNKQLDALKPVSE